MFSPAPARRIDFDRIVRASQRRFRTMLVDDYRPIADRLIAANRNVQTALSQLLLDFDARAATRGMTARELAQDRATVRLLNATQDELTDYTRIIRTQSSRAQLSGIAGGIREGAATLELLDVGTVASITPETAGRLINYADSPAFDGVLRHYAGYHTDYVRDMMTNLAARGVHPETVARWVTRYVENVPMYDAVRMTRTLQVYAARGGSRELYRGNGITEWVWSSARDGRTCPACWAMHGTRHSVDEMLNDHHMGRCAPVPVTPTWQSLGFEGGAEVEVASGETLFQQQPEAVQKRVLGPARWAAWKDGVFQLGDVVGEYSDDVYGPMRRARSLRELTGDTVAGAYRRTA